MKIEIKTLTEDAMNERGGDAYEIWIDGKKGLSFWDGEPEDATLARDFCDVFSIGDILEDAYQAGLKGEEFEININIGGLNQALN